MIARVRTQNAPDIETTLLNKGRVPWILENIFSKTPINSTYLIVSGVYKNTTKQLMKYTQVPGNFFLN